MPQKELPIRIGMSSMEEKKETAGMTHLHRSKKKKRRLRQANGVLLLCNQRRYNWTVKVHLGIKQKAPGTLFSQTSKKLPTQKHSEKNFIVLFDWLYVRVQYVCVLWDGKSPSAVSNLISI